MEWKQDQERLRQEIKEAHAKGGFRMTMLCTLLSHMRGRLHMRWYNKYEGGWRAWSKTAPKKDPAPKEMKAAYGDMAQQYYEWSAIDTLEDQKEFIRMHYATLKDEELLDLANRVISGYPMEEAKAHVA